MQRDRHMIQAPFVGYYKVKNVSIPEFIFNDKFHTGDEMSS